MADAMKRVSEREAKVKRAKERVLERFPNAFSEEGPVNDQWTVYLNNLHDCGYGFTEKAAWELAASRLPNVSLRTDSGA